MKELKLKEREKDETIELAKSILAKAHPDAIPVIKHWISIIQSVSTTLSYLKFSYPSQNTDMFLFH